MPQSDAHFNLPTYCKQNLIIFTPLQVCTPFSMIEYLELDWSIPTYSKTIFWDEIKLF